MRQSHSISATVWETNKSRDLLLYLRYLLFSITLAFALQFVNQTPSYLECAVVFVFDQRLNSEFLPCQEKRAARGL